MFYSMYKNFKKMAMLLFVAATMLTVACSKENNGGNSGSGESSFTMAKADVTYRITIESSSVEALRKAYDVFIDFYDANGQIQTSTEVNADNLNWNKNLTLTTFPAWYGAQFRLVPKSDLSGVAEDAKFNFNATFEVNGTGTSTTGKTRSVGEDKQQIDHTGIKPHNGRSYKKCIRYNVQTNGTYHSSMEWE